MENNKTKKIRIVHMIIILLIIINLFLFLYERFGRINDLLKTIPNNNEIIPTGNVDIFNINIDCTCQSNCQNKNTEVKKNIPVYNKEEDQFILDKVFVDDNQGNYIYQNNLRIFTNSAFYHIDDDNPYNEEYEKSYSDRIAPGISNSYYFVAHNDTDMNLKYTLNMYEQTSYKINMKYRLKRNNEYIIGNDDNWVTTEKLQTEFTNITPNSSDVYQLDWKWFDDDENDTIAGINMKDQYKLNIRFYFEEA